MLHGKTNQEGEHVEGRKFRGELVEEQENWLLDQIPPAPASAMRHTLHFHVLQHNLCCELGNLEHVG